VTWTTQEVPAGGGWWALASRGDVAIGSASTQEGGTSLWINSNAPQWEQVNSRQDSLVGWNVSGLTTWNGLFVASGWGAARIRNNWSSVDGFVWTEGGDQPDAEPDEALAAVASAGDLLLAFGARGSVWQGSLSE
jgi:hypothetical protein